MEWNGAPKWPHWDSIHPYKWSYDCPTRNWWRGPLAIFFMDCWTFPKDWWNVDVGAKKIHGDGVNFQGLWTHLREVRETSRRTWGVLHVKLQGHKHRIHRFEKILLERVLKAYRHTLGCLNSSRYSRYIDTKKTMLNFTTGFDSER